MSFLFTGRGPRPAGPGPFHLTGRGAGSPAPDPAADLEIRAGARRAPRRSRRPAARPGRRRAYLLSQSFSISSSSSLNFWQVASIGAGVVMSTPAVFSTSIGYALLPAFRNAR